MMAKRGQTHGSDTSALRAIGIATELAGRHPAHQVRAHRFRGAGKDALARRTWGMEKLTQRRLGHIHFREAPPQVNQFLDSLAALGRGEALLQLLAALWG